MVLWDTILLSASGIHVHVMNIVHKPVNRELCTFLYNNAIGPTAGPD